MHPAAYPNGLPKRLGRTFPEQLTIRTGEPPEIPKTQSEGNLGDGRLVWRTPQKKLPGLMQTKDAKVRYGREAVASLKRGSESSLRHAGLSSQIRDGQCLVAMAQGKFYR